MTHPKSHNFIPIPMYRMILQLAGDNGELSVKEVEVMFLRDWLERFGFKCEHPHNRIVFSQKTGVPYCKDCWRRLEKKEVKVLENGRIIRKTYFEQIETFVDRWNQDNKPKEKAAREPNELDEQVKQDLR